MKYTIPSDALVAHLEDEVMILHPVTRDYYRLNETGQQIWRMLEQGYDLDRVADELAASYDIERDAARQEAARLIDDLLRNHLVLEQK